MNSERVLCAPTSVFHTLGVFQGFCPEAERYLDALLRPGIAQLCSRSEVEEDPKWKQIIPYCFLTHGESVFVYRRGVKSGEQRLLSRFSLGIGGHVNAEDCEYARAFLLFDGLTEPPWERLALDLAASRELQEEITLGRREPRPRVVCGLINDDETGGPVGRVHLGVVMRVELSAPRVEARCASIEDGRFIAVDELAGLRSEMESWSAILCDHLPSRPYQEPRSRVTLRRG
jgi:predicted NUDIX family phosphoesterase